ncbi:hypothetical protein SLS62_010873 [Diatrype stigma]|uniref:Uncharacterized protein n=1 Tax=Diatrype stigma TaxID=117547 RepID=A0AAN9YGU9_9PEZI
MKSETSDEKACANCIYNWQKKRCSHHMKRPAPMVQDADGDVLMGEAAGEGPGLEGVVDEVAEEDRAPGDAGVEAEQERELEQAPGPGPRPVPAAGIVPENRELDDWEVIRPGILQGDSGTGIGFANIALRGSDIQTVYQGAQCSVALQIETLQPATRTPVEAKAAMRTVTVAAGNVKVELEGKEFVSSPNSAFVVPAGSEGFIYNDWALPAVLHIVHVMERPINNA